MPSWVRRSPPSGCLRATGTRTRKPATLGRTPWTRCGALPRQLAKAPWAPQRLRPRRTIPQHNSTTRPPNVSSCNATSTLTSSKESRAVERVSAQEPSPRRSTAWFSAYAIPTQTHSRLNVHMAHMRAHCRTYINPSVSVSPRRCLEHPTLVVDDRKRLALCILAREHMEYVEQARAPQASLDRTAFDGGRTVC